jgi:L-aminopeptidase/D-esterase-like protein
MIEAEPRLPAGFSVGHWSDRAGGTGCTVVLAPDDSVAAGEVRGGGPGTRESDLLSPAAGARATHALLFTGGSAYGLGAADGVVRWLERERRGYRTRFGHIIPLVPAAVIFDLTLGDPGARPGPEAGAAACEAATATPERGTVGAGTGAAVGKVLGPDGWVKGGFGMAAAAVGDARVTALAVTNAVGDVLAEDGSVLAGPRRDGGFVRTVDVLRSGEIPEITAREATTLVCVLTDARMTKTEAWLLARAANSGIARVVDPAHTAVDGDASFVIAAGDAGADHFALAATVPHVVAAAIRDGVRSATTLHGCPAIRDL